MDRNGQKFTQKSRIREENFKIGLYNMKFEVFVSAGRVFN